MLSLRTFHQIAEEITVARSALQESELAFSVNIEHSDSAELINMVVLNAENNSSNSDHFDNSHPFFKTGQLLSPDNQSLLSSQSSLPDGLDPLHVSHSSVELLSLLAESAKGEQDKMANLIEQMRAEDLSNPSAASTSDFRRRRLTYDRKDGDSEAIFSPSGKGPTSGPTSRLTLRTAAPKVITTCVYASSEIGDTLRGREHPPFPADVMGTYSCHGVEVTSSFIHDEAAHVNALMTIRTYIHTAGRRRRGRRRF